MSSEVEGADGNAQRGAVSGCEGLGTARPREGVAHQRQAPGSFGAILRFVVDAPQQDAVVLGERAHHVLDVLFETSPLRRIIHVGSAGGLHPAGIVYAGHRIGLLAQVSLLGIPVASIGEEGDHGPDVVLLADIQELSQAILESRRIGFPHQVVQEDPHGVEPQVLRPAQFPVDRLGIERLGLPGFDLVDRRGRDVVASDRPGLGLVPLVGLLDGPAWNSWCVLCHRRSGHRQRDRQRQSGAMIGRMHRGLLILGTLA